MAVRAGRLVWLGHLLDVQKVAGSNPVRPTIHILWKTILLYNLHLWLWSGDVWRRSFEGAEGTSGACVRVMHEHGCADV
jgi:hypothetical protein